jgi:Domain of unknown function (DUF4129)
MVNLSTSCWIAFLLISQNPTPPSQTSEDSSRAIRSALEKGKFPWYDEKTDAARPIKPRTESDVPPASSASSSSPGSSPGFLGLFGNAVTMIGFGIGLAVLIALLVWFWRMYEPSDPDEESRESKNRGEPSRVESLPEGMDREFESSDPWAEAIRRRNRGDLAGAIICLFAHQLLTLSKLGLVRLAPGRTGRQLVKAVTDGELRTLIQPTLRMFEVVYYGHRSPTEAEFVVLWSAAETFEQRIAVGVAR